MQTRAYMTARDCAAMCDFHMASMYVRYMAHFNVCGEGVGGEGAHPTARQCIHGRGGGCVRALREKFK